MLSEYYLGLDEVDEIRVVKSIDYTNTIQLSNLRCIMAVDEFSAHREYILQDILKSYSTMKPFFLSKFFLKRKLSSMDFPFSSQRSRVIVVTDSNIYTISKNSLTKESEYNICSLMEE